jgi:glycosidase
MARFFSVVKEDVDKYKSALTWLLTCRGIPQMYYGDEFATTGTTSPNDGYVRLDFPGGWPGDKTDKFTIAGRTQKDQEIFQYLATLAKYRRTSSALTTGKFMQFVPEDGVYVYFRYDAAQTVMVAMNTGKEKKDISNKRFAERTAGFSKMKNIFTGELTGLKDFSLNANGSGVYELVK